MKKDPISLEASQASITTATVTIKVLQVNSRQLTQSPFRQLPVETLVNETEVKLLGTVWGWVNYAPAGSPDSATQFVAQFGDRLCRSPFVLRRLPEGAWTSELRAMKESYVQEAATAVLCHIAANPEDVHAYWHTGDDHSCGGFRFPLKERYPFGSLLLGEGPSQFFTAWEGMRADLRLLGSILYPSGFMREGTAVSKEEQKALAIESLRAQLDQGTGDLPERSWWETRLDELATQAADYVARWSALMETLRAAEQLYIAT